MYLSISGFFKEGEDDSLQFDVTVDAALNDAILDAMEWRGGLASVPDGEIELAQEQINRIVKILNISFPSNLVFYIGLCA